MSELARNILAIVSLVVAVVVAVAVWLDRR